MAEFFDKAVKTCGNAKLVSNWLMSDVARILNEQEIDIAEAKFTAEQLGHLISLIEKNVISSAIAKKVFEDMAQSGKDPESIVEEKGLKQVTDEGAIRDIVIKVLDLNPASVADYLAGKERAMGFIVGQTMKESHGKANPVMVNKLVKEELEKRK